MTDDGLDPLIHVPTRLKIVATLAALPDGDALSVSRLRDMIGLPISSPIAGHPDPDGRLRCSPGQRGVCMNQITGPPSGACCWSAIWKPRDR
jgi:hypothetical protein